MCERMKRAELLKRNVSRCRRADKNTLFVIISMWMSIWYSKFDAEICNLQFLSVDWLMPRDAKGTLNRDILFIHVSRIMILCMYFIDDGESSGLYSHIQINTNTTNHCICVGLTEHNVYSSWGHLPRCFEHLVHNNNIDQSNGFWIPIQPTEFVAQRTFIEA